MWMAPRLARGSIIGKSAGRQRTDYKKKKQKKKQKSESFGRKCCRGAHQIFLKRAVAGILVFQWLLAGLRMPSSVDHEEPAVELQFTFHEGCVVSGRLEEVTVTWRGDAGGCAPAPVGRG